MSAATESLGYGVVYWRHMTEVRKHGFNTFDEAKRFLIEGENQGTLASEAITKYDVVVCDRYKNGRSPEDWAEGVTPTPDRDR